MRGSTCGDNGGVDIYGSPCGNYPVARKQEIVGRCRFHGDEAGEPSRQRRKRRYAQQEAEKKARTTLSAAHWTYKRARKRAEKAILAAQPAINELAIAKRGLEQARERCTELGVSTAVAPRNLVQKRRIALPPRR